jgi:hypothetical protein
MFMPNVIKSVVSKFIVEGDRRTYTDMMKPKPVALCKIKIG